MRILDAFCKQGGCSAGYREAGFEVEGVDIEPQPLYPGRVFVADAIAFIREHGHKYDAIHGSPPCQLYMTGGLVNRENAPDLVAVTREAIKSTGRPGIVENNTRAPIRHDLVLCGSMFGLKVRRHRAFELVGWSTDAKPPPCDHKGQGPIVGVYGHPHGKRGAWPGMLPSTLGTWREAMGIDWMDAKGLAQAIPPAYTAWIGARLMEALKGEAR